MENNNRNLDGAQTAEEWEAGKEFIEPSRRRQPYVGGPEFERTLEIIDRRNRELLGNAEPPDGMQDPWIPPSELAKRREREEK